MKLIFEIFFVILECGVFVDAECDAIMLHRGLAGDECKTDVLTQCQAVEVIFVYFHIIFQNIFSKYTVERSCIIFRKFSYLAKIFVFTMTSFLGVSGPDSQDFLYKIFPLKLFFRTNSFISF